MRSAGTVQTFAARSISPQREPKTSPVRAPVLRLSPAQNQSVNLPGQCLDSGLGPAAYSSDVAGPDEIYVVPLAGGGSRRVTFRGGALSWEPSMSPRFCVRHKLDRVRVPRDRRRPRRDLEDPGGRRWPHAADERTRRPPAAVVACRRQDRIPALHGGAGQVGRVHHERGWQPFDVTNSPSTDDTDQSWSPSGKWIVYSSDGPNIAIANLFAIPAAGGRRIQVTHYTGYDGAPGWSHDSASIAFESAPLRDPKTERAEPRLQAAVAKAVTVIEPLGAALVAASADQPFDIGFHQDLQHGFRHGSQEIAIAALLQQFDKRHSVVGHRGLGGRRWFSQFHLNALSR
jgi:TolB protein